MTGKQGKMRVKSVTAKVTEAEEKRLIEAAEAHGLRLAEWSRMTLLRAADFPQSDRVLLEEIEAVRSLCLTAFAQAAGVKGEDADAFYKRVNRQLDQQKQAKADQRIWESQTGREAGKETAA
jgi:hypothetical protein